jgi:valyl-tRNA synthetase
LEIPKRFDPAEVERRWSAHWLRSGYFTPDPASGAEPFCIVIPPPNITGRLHAGHALNNTLQDVLVRWRRMQGRTTLWLPGTDHAGIATQMVVERELQKEGKSRHLLGREAFQERVWAWREEHGGAIVEQLKRLGASCDWSRLRFTLDEGLSGAVREVFVRLYEEGLIYRGPAIVNWCPSCRTALSDLEVVHKEVVGKLYSIRYPLKEGGGSITVATTRPETMLGDTAVAVHPVDERYAGLIGKTAILPILGRELPILGDDSVDATFGTGAVKVTPAHDPNDFAIGRRHQLPAVRILDEQAKMTAEAGPYAGLDRYACRKKLVADLEASGSLVKVEEHRHAVGRCDRSDTVVEPSLSDQWFVRMETLASEALRAVEDGRIRFVPENRRNDYYEWMRNIHDWCISRQLWWGHRIPAWHCARCSHLTVARAAPAACGACGAPDPVQDPDVLDTWFSSALWPFSTLGWPDTQAADLKRFYPTTVLVTGYDILFFWVARMIMMGLKFMGEIPFHQVYFNGLVRDDKGRKMSKTRGNTVDPLEIMERHGTDALRFTLAAMSSPGADVLLDLKRLEGYQAFANKIWNAARFTQMNLDPATAATEPRFRAAGKELALAHRWIISRVNGTAEEVSAALEEFRFDAAAAALHRFFWHEFCDWYLEMVKPSLLGGEAEAARVARTVLLRTLDRALRLLHPFMPFLTEEIWQNLPHQGDSLVVAAFPAHRPEEHDEEAEREMQFLMSVVSKLRNLRAEGQLDPGRKAEALFKTDLAYPRRLLEEHAATVASLARLAGARFVAEIPRDGAVRGVVTGLEMALLLPRDRDEAEERGRLSRELDKIARELGALEAKLANDSFVSRAPAEVVEKVRSSQLELAGKRDKLERALATLSDPPTPPAHAEES